MMKLCGQTNKASAHPVLNLKEAGWKLVNMDHVTGKDIKIVLSLKKQYKKKKTKPQDWNSVVTAFHYNHLQYTSGNLGESDLISVYTCMLTPYHPH